MNDLTTAELEVMQILWDHGELKPQEVLRHHPRTISNSTLRTFLTDLVEKGHVTRSKRGKVYYYQALTPRKTAFRFRMEQIVRAFSGGSYLTLARQLVESEHFSLADLAELRRMLDKVTGEPAMNSHEA